MWWASSYFWEAAYFQAFHKSVATQKGEGLTAFVWDMLIHLPPFHWRSWALEDGPAKDVGRSVWWRNSGSWSMKCMQCLQAANFNFIFMFLYTALALTTPLPCPRAQLPFSIFLRHIVPPFLAKTSEFSKQLPSPLVCKLCISICIFITNSYKSWDK